MIAGFLRASLLAVVALAFSIEFATADDPTETEKSAAKLYTDNCATCHQANGQGVAGSIPPLAGNPAVVAAKPFDALSVVLAGVPARDGLPAMPSFGGSLDDRGVADVVNYIRTSWGNAAAPNATRSLVAAWRTSLTLPVYASAAARRFDCPNVGQGGAASFDPALIAAAGWGAVAAFGGVCHAR
jgi:mono/diheme cytochrome c family protein